MILVILVVEETVFASFILRFLLPLVEILTSSIIFGAKSLYFVFSPGK